MGYHTVLQTQYALGMSLTTEDRAGSILGRMTAIHNGGALVAMGDGATGYGYVSVWAENGADRERQVRLELLRRGIGAHPVERRASAEREQQGNNGGQSGHRTSLDS